MHTYTVGRNIHIKIGQSAAKQIINEEKAVAFN